MAIKNEIAIPHLAAGEISVRQQDVRKVVGGGGRNVTTQNAATHLVAF